MEQLTFEWRRQTITVTSPRLQELVVACQLIEENRSVTQPSSSELEYLDRIITAYMNAIQVSQEDLNGKQVCIAHNN